MEIAANRIKKYITKYSYQIFIFFAFITIYLATMFPGVGGRINFGDSGKWHYLHLANGLPHGTGYPQFLIITEVFYRIIFFLDEWERITFVSVFFGALSLSVFYSLLYLLTKNRTGSLITTFLTGFTYIFWAQATEAEVYTLNTFYLLSVFYMFIKFYLTKKSSYYLVGCAVYAFSFGNHLSMATILPAIVFISMITNYKIVFSPRNILLVLGFIVAGMLQYAIILYRAYTSNPLYTEIVPKPTASEFLTYITGSHKSSMLAFSFEDILFKRFPVLYGFINENYTVLGIVFAFAGFFYYLYIRKQYVILAFLFLAMLGQIVFNISYDVGDLIVFFIPVYIIIGIFIGLVFSVNNTLIPKIILSVLAIYLFRYNIKNKDILIKNNFELVYFKPIVSLYREQKENLPLYFKSYSYGMHIYMNYIDLATNLAPKVIYNSLDPIRTNSFFTAYGPDHYPELAQEYDVQLVAREGIKDFVAKHNTSNEVVFLSAMDEASQNLPRNFIDFLKTYGSKVETLPYRGSYAAVFYKGKVLERINASGSAIIQSDSIMGDLLAGQLSYKVYSAGQPFGNSSEIIINDFDFSSKRRGINIVVYNINLNIVTDMVNFDTFEGEEKKLYKAVKRRPALPVPH